MTDYSYPNFASNSSFMANLLISNSMSTLSSTAEFTPIQRQMEATHY